MAWWKKFARSNQPRRGMAGEPPAGAQRGSGRLAQPTNAGSTRSPGGRAAVRTGGYARSEAQVITDGQLGGANLDRGPERANPEGSVDISNGDYRE